MNYQRNALALLAIFAALTPSLAQDSNGSEPDPETKDVRFRILNNSDEPVSGATVRLFHQTQTFRELVEHKLLHETKTDQDGYFRLPPGKQVANARIEDNGFSATWVTIPARDGKPHRTWLLGTSAGAYLPYMEMVYHMFSNPEGQKDLQKAVSILKSAPKSIPTDYSLPECETTVRVVNHDGSPAAGVSVTPIRIVWWSKGTGIRPISVPPQLRESMRQSTNEDGRVTFTTITRAEFAELEFESPQHGIQRTFTNANSIGDVLDKDLMLFPTGSVVGIVSTSNAADQAFLKGRKLLFKSQMQNSGLHYPKNKPIAMHGYAEVTVDDQGRFEIPVMLNGRLTLYDRLERNAPTRISFPPRLIVQPGQTTSVEGHVISTVLVHGVLRKRDTGEPVPSAAMSIRHGKRSGLSRELSVHSSTDENGRFEARVFPGIIGYSPLTVIPGHAPVYQWEQPPGPPRTPNLPYGQRATVPADVEKFALPPLELVPTITLVGKLIDADKQPVPNTGVYAFPVAGRVNCDFARTNGEGQFTLDRVPSTHPPTFFKAGKQHKTEPATIVSQEPLVLQVEVE